MRASIPRRTQRLAISRTLALQSQNNFPPRAKQQQRNASFASDKQLQSSTSFSHLTHLGHRVSSSTSINHLSL
ncbi:hypothetical protein D6C83_04716 [Aureobasidium pullulans]|uniref:Uncharacterized protein n=1 Tax=Aureobasidium pullulans TaxID=5580 RepID=A0A4V4LI99_AURPU|nr:hypothetical protein D6C83_04716 [Aureobasidium pullulans]